MNEIERKFIIGKLELRKFIVSDYLYLSAYIISVAYYFYSNEFKPEHKFLISFSISFIVGFLTISTAFGLRFRNVYFSAIWLSISILFLKENYPVAFIPLLTFILYHIFRLIFWHQYNREFIPFNTAKGGTMYRHRSFFENRSGNSRDKEFTRFLLWVGIFLVMICVFQMTGLKINKNYR